MTRRIVLCIGTVVAVLVILSKQAPVAAQLQGTAAPLNRLFTQDTYTQYTLLNPATQQFRIEFRQKNPESGPRTLTGSGSRAKGRVLIYKTFKDPRTYMVQGEDIVWARNLIGYRLGVVLPKGFAFLSSNIAAQLTTQADGLLKLAFANPSGGQGNPLTIHARRTKANFAPVNYNDVFFDDIKTLYDLDAPETRSVRVEQVYSDFRKGDTAKLDSLSYLPLQDLKVVDLDTAKALAPIKSGAATVVKLYVPIATDMQSVRIKITGTLKGAGYKVENGELVFDRTVQGLRNTVLLPEGWEVAAVSESATLGMYRGRAFVAFVNINAANNYNVVIRARKRSA
jgi:hypothetical protein